MKTAAITLMALFLPLCAVAHADLEYDCDQGEESACVELQGAVQDYYARQRDDEAAERAAELQEQRERFDAEQERHRVYEQHNWDLINNAFQPWH